MTHSFSSAETLKDYEALVQGRAVLDFSSCGKIKVGGNDRIEFLQNILTNDIKKLKTGETCLAALLHASGKTLAFMEVLLNEDHVVLLMEAGLAAKTITLLDRYIIADDVTLEDVTDQFSLIYEMGGKTGEFQSRLFLPEAAAFLKKKEEIKNAVNESAYEMFRTEQGVLRYGKDFDETVILSETGLDPKTVSTTKGCYPGQEVIAKIETYSGLQRKIHAFSYEGNACPPIGTKILTEGGQEAGEIRSITPSPKLKRNLMFGYLSRRCAPEKPVWFQLEGQTVELRREEIAFR